MVKFSFKGFFVRLISCIPNTKIDMMAQENNEFQTSDHTRNCIFCLKVVYNRPSVNLHTSKFFRIFDSIIFVKRPNMKLEIISASSFDSNVKCSIHKNGKLGFSSTACTRLGIDIGKSVLFAKDTEDTKEENLYIVVQDTLTSTGFRLNKAGKYYYLNTKALFDELGIDYRKRSIVFDIVSTDILHEDKKVFKLIKREVGSRK